MKKIVNKFFINFFNGIVILLPIAITVSITRFIVFKINEIVLNPILRMFSMAGFEITHVNVVKTFIFFGVIIGIAAIGRSGRILFVNRFFSFWESMVIKLPILGKIYNAIKQISTAFLGHGKTIFKKVVLVEYPRQGIHSIGFITGETRGEIKNKTGEEGLSVFIPTTPNPTSGMYVIVPKGKVKELDMSVEDGMKLIVSGGSVSPEEISVKR
ncbi:MAG: DUF502 domain-containing protein [Candidatus Omnitrophica bacterium]|nr:DUF502 domain-containing protein [Candidatus Omnitrophota bacterium]